MGCCSSQQNADGNYDPSCFTLCFGTSSTSSYRKIQSGEKYNGSLPILVACTDDGNMKMKNGKVFNTGNHPVEMLVPMLHFSDAGFKFDIATTSGKPVVLEMWAYPKKDENVAALYKEVKPMLEAPKKIEDITSMDGYAAIFIPGGHGAMLNLPTNDALGKLLCQAHERGLPTVTLCHGPAALLSTALEGRPFAYEGYKAMCFTDKTDAMTPKIGYLPGPMPWKVQEKLEEKGLTIVNKKETGATIVDRELITGDSPDAANNLGVTATPVLVKHANSAVQVLDRI